VVACSHSLGGSLSRNGAIRPEIQIGKPALPEHGPIGSQAGDGDCERLREKSKTGEGRAPVPSAEPEPGDGGIAAVPADDLPGEGVGLGRPDHSQLITSRPKNAERVPTRVCGPTPEVGLAPRPVAAWCWLIAHADASDPSHDPPPANLSAGSTRARARPRCSVAPGVGEPRLGRSKLIGTRGRSARPRLVQERLVRSTASAPCRRSSGARSALASGHERRFLAAEVRAERRRRVSSRRRRWRGHRATRGLKNSVSHVDRADSGRSSLRTLRAASYATTPRCCVSIGTAALPGTATPFRELTARGPHHTAGARASHKKRPASGPLLLHRAISSRGLFTPGRTRSSCARSLRRL
jgi:hypothetical protein